ncbi:radical SAM family heme chaperone HemW [bacterium]|nr:radical SAM family heme chaperone HemW [bacterium]
MPFCLQRCAYCDFASYALNALPEGLSFTSYADALIKEAGLAAGEHGSLRFTTIYIGGGTPSLMPLDELQRVVAAMREAFDVSRLKEFTLEANPDTLGRDKLRQWSELGVTRLSVGIQSLSDRSLRELGRSYSSGGALTAFYELADELSAFDLSFDLLLNVPWQKPLQVLDDIRTLYAFEPAHFSLYSLKVEPGTPLAMRVANEPGLAPDNDRFADEMNAAEELLEESGFARYEISNFARDGKWSLHNLTYWRGGDYLGLGVNATGCINSVRTRNHREFADYRAALSQDALPIAERTELSETERAFERLMLALRTTWGISRDAFAAGIWEKLQARAEELAARHPQLIVVAPGRIALTSGGMNVEHALVVELAEGVF